MELFNLVAKLTLDAKEYESAIAEAEGKGKGISDIEAVLDLDTTPFDAAVEEAEGTEVSNPDSPELGLDKSAFDSGIAAADEAEVPDPDDPELDLNKSEFDSAIKAADAAEVSDPDDPALGLDTTNFDAGITNAENTVVPDPAAPALGLDTSGFDAGISEAGEAYVPDPAAPSLGLDSSEFAAGVASAENAVITDPAPPDLDLDASRFNSKVDNAENTTISDPDTPSLGLDTSAFVSAVSDAENTVVSDPSDPSLDLDSSAFDTAVSDAEGTEVADPATPNLDLNTSAFSGALDDAEADANNFDLSIGSILENVKSAILVSGIAAAITGVVDGLKEAINLAATLGDNVDKGSRKMNISTQAYQEWSHALSQSGASITDFNRATLTMNKALSGDMTEDVEEAFTKLGLNFKIANGEISTTEDLLKATVMSLADFEGTSEERGAIATALFGRGGNTLNALFDSGSDGIQALIDEAHELGLVMTQEEVDNAVAYGDALANFNASVEAFKTAIVADILPGLTDVYNRLAAIVAFFNPRTHSNSLSDEFGEVDEQLASDLVNIEATSQAAGTLIDKLFSMGDAEKLTAEQQAEWKATAEWLVENIPSLSSVIDLDTLSISSNKDEILKTVQAWKEYAIERAKANALQSKREALANKTTEWLQAETDAAQLEAESERANAKYRTLVRQDFENLPADKQQAFLRYFNYSGLEDLDWSPGSALYKQLGGAVSGENATLSAMLGGLFGSFGSEETRNAWNEFLGLEPGVYGSKTTAAREKADKLKAEVEAGTEELANYSATLDTVVAGLVSTGDSATDAQGDVETLHEELDNLPESETTDVYVNTHYNSDGEAPVRHAKGAWSIPYDDYPALLHRGERVLTAAQARQMDSGGGAAVDMATLAKVVEDAIRSGMEGVSVNSYLNGQDVTDSVNRTTGRQLKARRFRR